MREPETCLSTWLLTRKHGHPLLGISVLFDRRFRQPALATLFPYTTLFRSRSCRRARRGRAGAVRGAQRQGRALGAPRADRKSTRLNSSHLGISYAVFCLKKKNPGLEKWPSLEAAQHGGAQQWGPGAYDHNQ